MELTKSEIDSSYKFKGLRAGSLDAVFIVQTKGFLSKDRVMDVDEKTCFDMAKQIGDVVPRLSSHSDAVYSLEQAGALVQKAKLERGLPLACAKHSGVDSWNQVAYYRD